jgi:hypothetical protein
MVQFNHNTNHTPFVGLFISAFVAAPFKTLLSFVVGE